MPPASDFILIGAGRHPHTKQKRQLRQPRHRNRWIGTVQVSVGLRIPVNLEFVKQHFKQLVEAVNDGVVLVEYKTDRFVDPEELQTLAFGDAEARESYEARIQAEVQADAQTQRDKELERKAADDQVAAQNELARQLRGSGMDPKKAFAEGQRAELTEEQTEEEAMARANALEETYSNNLDGTHAVHFESQQEVADELTKTRVDAPEGPEAPGEAQGDATTPPEQKEPAVFKPLPEGWQKNGKNDLLTLCEERGIDVSDVPSNKELKKRLEDYEVTGA